MTPDKSDHSLDSFEAVNTNGFTNFNEAYESFKPIIGKVSDTFVSQEDKPVRADLTIYRPLTKTWVDRTSGGEIVNIEPEGLSVQFDDLIKKKRQVMAILVTGIESGDGITTVSLAGSRFDSHQLLLGSMLESGVRSDVLVKIVKSGIDLSSSLDALKAYCGAVLSPDANFNSGFDSYCGIQAFMNFPFQEPRLIRIVFERMRMIRESIMRTSDDAMSMLGITQLQKPLYSLSIKDIASHKLINVDDNARV